MAGLRAAVITDIHHGRDSGAKLGSRAARLLEKFAKAAAFYGPDLVIDMGDRITASDAEEAARLTREVKGFFNRIAAPAHFLTGNHDIKHMSAADNAAITGSGPGSYSAAAGGYHLVFWNPAAVSGKNREGKGKGGVTAQELDWLRRDLAAARGPAIVFSHIPLDNNGDEHEALEKAGRKGSPWTFYFREGPEIRRIMEESGKVRLCLSGHHHCNRHREIGGIHYITQQSLTQAWQKKYKVPAGAWSWLEAGEKTITVRLQGKTKKTYRLDFS